MSSSNTTPFPDGGAIEMVKVNLFEFEMMIPNADGRVVGFTLRLSDKVVRELVPQMTAWLEGVDDAHRATP